MNKTEHIIMHTSAQRSEVTGFLVVWTCFLVVEFCLPLINSNPNVHLTARQPRRNHGPTCVAVVLCRNCTMTTTQNLRTTMFPSHSVTEISLSRMFPISKLGTMGIMKRCPKTSKNIQKVPSQCGSWAQFELCPQNLGPPPLMYSKLGTFYVLKTRVLTVRSHLRLGGGGGWGWGQAMKKSVGATRKVVKPVSSSHQ